MEADFRSIPGLKAGSSLAALQYHAVKLDTTENQVVPITDGNAERPIGILQNDPANGEAALVAYDGICKAECGGVITFGATLVSDNDGGLIVDVEVVDGTAVDIHHIATALQAGVDTEVILVLLHTPIRIGKE